MTYFVIGGSGSGKSLFAETIINNSNLKNRTYIATMRVWDDEGQKRVEKHREMRKNKGFETLECHTNLEEISNFGDCVLLEDLTNLFMNEWYGDDRESAFSRVCKGLELLHQSAETFVIVANDIFTDGVNYGEETEDLLENLGKLNTFAAGLADSTFEVVCGIETHICGKILKASDGMTLIIGGKYQGKSEYAMRVFDRGRGACTDIENAEKSDIFLSLDEWLKNDDSTVEKLEILLGKNPNIVITCAEVGCGVVPLDKNERIWREKVGRVSTFLATKATRVIRIMSGVPFILKDE